MASEWILTNGSTPSTPAAGKNALFFGSAAVYPSTIDSSAVVRLLGGSTSLVNFSISDPVGTTDTTGKMAGIAQSFTPTSTGKTIFIASGNLSNSTATAGNGCKVGIRYSTGSAPTNGANLIGSTGSSVVTSVLERNTSDLQGFCCVGGASLTVGVTYWVDLTQAAIVAGTGVITNIGLVVYEVY